MNNLLIKFGTAGLAITMGMGSQVAAQTSQKQSFEPNRTILPIPKTVSPLITEPDVHKAKMPSTLKVEAPKNAPNVLVILIDDMGFGHPNAFGGPINMPTLGRISSEGLRYNRFHTCAVSSATRASLLTGNNSHTVNCGEIADNATGFPGNTFVRPDNVTPLAEILRLNGCLYQVL